jgi:dephospho-CoA kinase
VEQGVLQRKKLGSLVFADPAALGDLNTITHRHVAREVETLLTPRPALAAIDAIALFESGLDQLCDCTVAITAPVEDRVRRLMAREGISENYARQRIAAQHADTYFREHCDFVLENNASQEKFLEECIAFFRARAIL